MKKQTKSELQKQAEVMMKAHNVSGITATEDGNFFLPADQSAAIDYKNQTQQELFAFGDLAKAEVTEAGDIVELATAEVEKTKAAVQVAFYNVTDAKAAMAAGDKDAKEVLGKDVDAADAVYTEAGKALEAAEAALDAAQKEAKKVVKAASKAKHVDDRANK